MGGSGWEGFTRISSYCCSSSRLHSWSYTFLILYINDIPDDVVCNIAICADDSILCSWCNQAYDLWQQLELASELESGLRDTGLRQNVFVDFNAEKTQLVSFDWSNNTITVDVKMDGSVLAKKSSLKMLEFSFYSKLD